MITTVAGRRQLVEEQGTALPAAALLLVVGDVLDDVERVGLPHGDGNLHVLLNGHVDLLDYFVRPVNRYVHLLDDFNWDFFDDLNGHWPLNAHVLSLVYRVGDVLHNVNVDWVGLGYGNFDLLADGHGDRLWHGELDVAGHLHRDTTNDILHNRLQLVSGSGSHWAADGDSCSNDSRGSKSCRAKTATTVVTRSRQVRVEKKATLRVSVT